MQMAFDVIGDIHGQYDKLAALMGRLGYAAKQGGWRAPSGRQALFIGDLIDRGPAQIEVLRAVRSMIDAGDARCVLGNHEFNAIGYVTPRRDGSGQFLREHSPKNVAQHAEFLRQVGEGSARHREWVQWFRRLPPALDLGGIRAVHAWWHQPHVDRVARAGQTEGLTDDDFLHEAHARGTAAWAAIEGLTKGLEIALPAPYGFVDHGGVIRHEVRTRWWLEAPKTYREVALVGAQADAVPDHPLPAGYQGASVTGAPVFVGHYWMGGPVELQTHKVACVDWSAAKDGPLVAYRWDGEQVLDRRRFVCSHEV
jgi:hypothetical protein